MKAKLVPLVIYKVADRTLQHSVSILSWYCRLSIFVLNSAGHGKSISDCRKVMA